MNKVTGLLPWLTIMSLTAFQSVSISGPEAPSGVQIGNSANMSSRAFEMFRGAKSKKLLYVSEFFGGLRGRIFLSSRERSRFIGRV